MNRRAFLILGITALAGCSGPAIRSQSPEADLLADSAVTLVGDLTRPYGMNYVKVEEISLVTGLRGTGGDPPPSPQRAAVLAEMQRRKVNRAAQVLASPDTALVLVRGFLRPGIQKGDRFDVEVRVPSRSEVESLRGGWLLQSRMTELAVLDNQVHSGHVLALAEGPVLVHAAGSSDDGGVQQTQGVILGGGVALKTRTLGLVLDDEHQSVRASQQVGGAINRRFHTYVRGVKQGVASPKTDQFIELVILPVYKNNIERYIRVLGNVAYRETPGNLQHRLQLLERQLLDPVTAATAALRLEAIGKEAIEVLKTGIAATDPEVRFYAAEALAYLGEPDAAEPLAVAARDEPAFRVHALAALSTLEDVAAHEQLQSLLSSRSAETRYGAFRALWLMNPHDPLIHGEQLGGQFSFHMLEVDGPAMIHVTRSLRPEIVLFGPRQTFNLPMIVEAGPFIVVKGLAEGGVTVSRFAVGEPDQKRQVTAGVDDVIRAIVELGGTYPDVVQAISEAKESGALPSRLKVDALPASGRPYRRGEPHESAEQTAGFSVTTPLSELFAPWKKMGQ